MLLYIDESGNPGKKDTYMVIAGIIFDNPKKAKRFARKYCKDNNLCEIKASQMKFSQRKKFLTELNKKITYKVHYIVLNKDAIYKEELFKRKNILYNYMCKIFLKDIFQLQTENIHLCFDNRTVKPASLNSLSDYLQTEAYAIQGMSGQLRIEFLDSKGCYCIQIADVMANTIYQKYERGYEYCYNMLAIERAERFPQNAFSI